MERNKVNAGDDVDDDNKVDRDDGDNDQID